MKKPTKNTNFGLQVHHVIEAIEDSLQKEMAQHGLTEQMIADELDQPGVHGLDKAQVALLGAHTELEIIHTVIHDLMEHQDLNKLSDRGLRRVVLKYKSEMEKGMTEDQLKAYKEGLGI